MPGYSLYRDEVSAGSALGTAVDDTAGSALSMEALEYYGSDMSHLSENNVATSYKPPIEHNLNLNQPLDPSKKTAVILREGNAPEFSQEYNFYQDLYGDDLNLIDIPLYYDKQNDILEFMSAAMGDFRTSHRQANIEHRARVEHDPKLAFMPTHVKHQYSDTEAPPYYNPLESVGYFFLSDNDYSLYSGNRNPMIEESLVDNEVANMHSMLKAKSHQSLFDTFIDDLSSIESAYNPDHVIMMSHQGPGLNPTFGIDLRKVDSKLSEQENLFKTADVYFGACSQGSCDHPEHQINKFKDVHYETTAGFLSDALGESLYASPRKWKGFNRVRQDVDSSEGFKESIFYNQTQKRYNSPIINRAPEQHQDISLYKDGYYIVPE